MEKSVVTTGMRGNNALFHSWVNYPNLWVSQRMFLRAYMRKKYYGHRYEPLTFDSYDFAIHSHSVFVHNVFFSFISFSSSICGILCAYVIFVASQFFYISLLCAVALS